MLALALLTLPLALAAPLRPRATAPVAEEITVMATHFMGSNSGLPGGTWPPGTAFNSTIDFTLVVPEQNFTTTCSGSWTPPAYPTTYAPCADPAALWRFEQSAGFSEGNFTLDVIYAYVDGSSAVVNQAGSVFVTDDSPGQPGNYLTCVGGPPLDGIRCSIGGFGGAPGPIPITLS